MGSINAWILFCLSLAFVPIAGVSPNNHTVPQSVPGSAYFDYVVTIIFENKGLVDIYGNYCGGNCTYIMQLANSYGLAENYSAIGHPSLPNYLALTSGGNYDMPPFDADCFPQSSGCSVSWPNLVDSIEASGRTWKAYMEDYSGGGCSRTHTSNDYVNNHNPFVYYSDIYGNATRCSRIVNANPGASGFPALPTQLFLDLNSTTTASNYMWLSPNTCDDGDFLCAPLNNTVSQSNLYLSRVVPRILNSTIFQTENSALFVVWDESGTHLNNYAAAIWAGPASKTGYKSMLPYSHYSAVRTIEDAWNLPTLTVYDLSATPMTEFLNAQGTVGGLVIPVDKLSLIVQFLSVFVIVSLAAIGRSSKVRAGTRRQRTPPCFSERVTRQSHIQSPY